jgi:hypothetical protein
MLRVFVCVALLLSGCAIDARPVPPLRVKHEIKTEKIPVACPTDEQIKAIAVEASRATYLNPDRPKGRKRFLPVPSRQIQDERRRGAFVRRRFC